MEAGGDRNVHAVQAHVRRVTEGRNSTRKLDTPRAKRGAVEAAGRQTPKKQACDNENASPNVAPSSAKESHPARSTRARGLRA